MQKKFAVIDCRTTIEIEESLKRFGYQVIRMPPWNELSEPISAHPDMLLTDKYRNGEMSQYYLKVGDEYIEKMLVELLPFYEALCSEFFDEDIEAANWNYDDYFAEKVKQAIKEVTNPLDA